MGKNFLLIIQIVLSLFLIVVILIQAKGVGLGQVFGGGLWGGYSTKRGVEKIVFNLTIILAILFFLSSIALLIWG